MDYILVYLIFSMINFIIAILGMLSTTKKLGPKDFWLTMTLLIFGPLGTLGLMVTTIILLINGYKEKRNRI